MRTEFSIADGIHQAMQDAEFRALVIEFLGGKAT